MPAKTNKPKSPFVLFIEKNMAEQLMTGSFVTGTVENAVEVHETFTTIRDTIEKFRVMHDKALELRRKENPEFLPEVAYIRKPHEKKGEKKEETSLLEVFSI